MQILGLILFLTMVASMQRGYFSRTSVRSPVGERWIQQGDEKDWRL